MINHVQKTEAIPSTDNYLLINYVAGILVLKSNRHTYRVPLMVMRMLMMMVMNVRLIVMRMLMVMMMLMMMLTIHISFDL